MNKSKSRQAMRRSLSAKFLGDNAVVITVTDLLTGSINSIVFNFVENKVEEKEVKVDGE